MRHGRLSRWGNGLLGFGILLPNDIKAAWLVRLLDIHFCLLDGDLPIDDLLAHPWKLCHWLAADLGSAAFPAGFPSVAN